MSRTQIKRNSSLHRFSGVNRSSGAASYKPYNLDYVDMFEQATQSHGQNWRGNPGSDTGGPWLMLRTTHDLSPIVLNHLRIKGPALCTNLSGYDYLASTEVSEANVKAYGTKALAESAPNNPAYSLAQTVGEIKKDGLPSPSGLQLWKEKSGYLKGSSSEYLNIEFGWKPLVNDVRRFANSVTNHKKIMDGYVERANSPMRVRHSAPPTQTSKSASGGVYILPTSGTLLASGSMFETDESQTWFSGSFVYHVPMGDDSISKMQRHYISAKKLLGVRLTPDTLWELAPWSWAADWGLNTGHIMANISNLGSDGLVMRYGYAMASWKKEVTTHFTFEGKSGYKRITTEVKKRVPASPYGFASTFDGLSTRQKAIAAAVGITRAR